MIRSTFIFIAAAIMIIFYQLLQLQRLRSELKEVKTNNSKKEQVSSAGASPIPPASLEQQSRCAKQAEAFFFTWNRDTRSSKTRRESRDYTNHFDPSVNACFIQIKSSLIPIGGQFGESRFISNVNESSGLADYFWISQVNKKYWEVAPMQCYVVGRDGQKHYCSSEEEYNNLARSTYGINQ